MRQYETPMVLADEYSHLAYGPCRLISVHGFNNNSGAGSDRWLQLFEKFPAALANGDVPNFKSLWFPSGAMSTYGRDFFGAEGHEFSELLAAVSSTEVNYTAVVNTGLDLTLVYVTSYYGPNGTIVGDLTTGVDNLDVWAHSDTNLKRLMRLDVKNNSGANAWVLVQAQNAFSATAKSAILDPKISNGATKTFLFGPNGGQIEEDSGGTHYKGCEIVPATAPTRPYAVQGAAGYNIRAVYET